MQQHLPTRRSTPKQTNKIYVVAWVDNNDADWDVVGGGHTCRPHSGLYASSSFKEALKFYETTLKNIIDDLNQEHALDTEHVEDVPKDQVFLLSFDNGDFESVDVWNKIDQKKYLRHWSAKQEVQQAQNCRRKKLPILIATLRYAYALDIIQHRLMRG